MPYFWGMEDHIGRLAMRHGLPRNFMAIQLHKGTKHEKEHTARQSVNPVLIAVDHLEEDPFYYVKIEGEAFKKPLTKQQQEEAIIQKDVLAFGGEVVDREGASMNTLNEIVEGLPQTVGVAKRTSMPQIYDTDYAAFEAFLTKHKIPHRRKKIPAQELIPTQKDISAARVQRTKDKIKQFKTLRDYDQANAEKLFIVANASSVGKRHFYVIDGHHRWAAYHAINKKFPCRVLCVTTSVKRAIALANQFKKETNAQ